MVAAAPSKKVVFSGMRPTGRLHLGNYWGALKNWISLQDQYQCYYSVVDWHMLTTGYEDTGSLQENIREMVLDWLAAGLDPEKCVVFKQSGVQEHAELALLLGMVTPLSWLENNPTWKEQLQELAKTKHSKVTEEQGLLGATLSGNPPEVNNPKIKPLIKIALASPGNPAGKQNLLQAALAEGKYELRTHGLLGYPVLQAADILLYRGEVVPVGQDQLPHIELAREIARRFNSIYGAILTEPQSLLTPTPKIPGIDGRKMSKSYGNALELLETPETLKAKVMSMYTDPKKLRANDPGHPEPGPENPPGCVVFALHKLYSDYAERRGDECRKGEIGCVACKKDLLKSLEGPFEKFRRARESFARQKGLVNDILEQGGRKARAVAEKTMAQVRTAMRLA